MMCTGSTGQFHFKPSSHFGVPLLVVVCIAVVARWQDQHTPHCQLALVFAVVHKVLVVLSSAVISGNTNCGYPSMGCSHAEVVFLGYSWAWIRAPLTRKGATYCWLEKVIKVLESCIFMCAI